MAELTTDNLVKGIDVPITELMNQIPFSTTALSAFTTAEDGTDKYIYGIVGSAFFKIDTESDSPVYLKSPYVAPVTTLDIRYTKRRGHHGYVLGATSGTVRIGGRKGNLFDGKTLRTLTNTGAGQEKVLTWVKDNVHDSGVVSGGALTSSFQDNTKEWKINQWKGYTVGLKFGTGQTEYRQILYNDVNTLYFYDVNLIPHEPWHNYPFAANAPYAVPVTTVALQTHYEIISQDFTVDTPWTIVPDTTTFFTTLTGGIYLFTAQAAAPFMNVQYYDCLCDDWQLKTVSQTMLDVALATDSSIERTGKIGTYFKTGTVSSVSGAGSRKVNMTGAGFEKGLYQNGRILIQTGTGAGQSRNIVSNGTDYVWINRNWDIVPDNTSTYEIWPDFDRAYLMIGGRASIIAYSPENDYTMTGQGVDDGICSVMSAKKGWDVPFAIGSGARIASGIQAINPVPTAGGTNYVIGDVLTCAVGGSGASVIVTSIATGGVVTGIELFSAGTGTGYTTGTGKATTGGTGTGCTIEITAVGPTVRVTCATNHTLKTGDVVTIAGNTDALHNGTKTILGVPSLTTFYVATTATANMATALAQTTTIIVDSSKNWIPNELKNKVINLMVAGHGPTAQPKLIASNTANTITILGTITAGVSGTSKYAIYDAKCFAPEELYKEELQSSDGIATGGSTTTLVDSTKQWIPDQWKNFVFDIWAGTGFDKGEITITGNNATTLFFGTQTFTPDDTTHYEIRDTWGVCTANNASSITETGRKTFGVNYLGGKRVKYVAGLGTNGAEVVVQTNTANVLTTTTNGLVAGDTSSVYSILALPARGAGSHLIWLWGVTKTRDKGRYMMIPRGGGSNMFDLWDIIKNRVEVSRFNSPQQELFNVGSSYAYDGANKVYLQRDNTGRVTVWDFLTNEVSGGMQFNDITGNVTGTAVIGNRLEIVKISGVKFLYHGQPTGQKLWRIQIID